MHAIRTIPTLRVRPNDADATFYLGECAGLRRAGCEVLSGDFFPCHLVGGVDRDEPYPDPLRRSRRRRCRRLDDGAGRARTRRLIQWWLRVRLRAVRRAAVGCDRQALLRPGGTPRALLRRLEAHRAVQLDPVRAARDRGSPPRARRPRPPPVPRTTT